MRVGLNPATLAIDDTRLRRTRGCRKCAGSQYLPLPQPARTNGATATSKRMRRTRIVITTVERRMRFCVLRDGVLGARAAFRRREPSSPRRDRSALDAV